MPLFGSKKEQLEKIATFAEALAHGENPSFILDQDDLLSTRLTKAFNQISETISSRSLEIEKESSHLTGILSTIAEGVLLTDTEGRIVLANKALRRFFSVKSDPIEKSLIEIFHQEKMQVACDQLLKEPGRISFELDLGILEETSLKVNFSTIENEAGVIGVVGVFIDMTQVKKLEKMRKEFVANISHELKTPLSSIKGYSETLLENVPSDTEKVKEFAGIIHRNAERLQHLVEDIMSLSRLEQKQEQLQRASVYVSEVTQEVIQQLGHLAELHHVAIEEKIDKDLPPLFVDVEKVKKVFAAILENAIQYIGEGKKVQINAVLKEDLIQIEISDNGPGIPQNAIPNLFERFYRVEQSRSRDVGGSGLGLAIAKHIVLAHGGGIWAESPQSRGASFYFTLPAVTKK